MLTEKQMIAVRKKLIDNKMTITELAQVIGISRAYLSGLLSGAISNTQREWQILEWKKNN